MHAGANSALLKFAREAYHTEETAQLFSLTTAK